MAKDRKEAGKKPAAPILLLVGLSLLIASCGLRKPVLRLTPPTPVPQTSLVKNPQPASGDAISLARPKGPPAGSVIGQVVVRDDPSLWIANALATGLEQAGYRVERTKTTEAAQTPMAISIDVEVLEVGQYGDYFRARLAARVKVYQGRRLTLDRFYSGVYTAPVKFAFVTGQAEAALDQAMKNFLSQALPDLTAFLARINQGSTLPAKPAAQ